MKREVSAYLRSIKTHWAIQCGPEFVTDEKSNAVRSIMSVGRNNPVNFGTYFFLFQADIQDPICENVDDMP